MNKLFIILQLFLIVSYACGQDNITDTGGDVAVGDDYDLTNIADSDDIPEVLPVEEYASQNETQVEQDYDAAVPEEEPEDITDAVEDEEANNQTEAVPDQDPDAVVPDNDYETDGTTEGDEIDGRAIFSIADTNITDVVPEEEGVVVEETSDVVSENEEDILPIDLCPDQCECDGESWKISCALKDLSELPSEIGAGYTSIDLTDNNISIIDANLLKNYGEITEIVLTRNKILVIDEDGFSGVPKLEHIGLSGNDLRVIHPNAFINNRNLAAICLNNNTHLQIAEGGSLLNIPSLKHLNLIGSNITEIPETFFEGTRGLESLNLANNPLFSEDQILNARAFSVLKNLTKLTVPESLNNISLSFLCTYCDKLYDICIDSCDTKNISCLYLQTHIEIEKYGEFVNHTGNILAKYGTEIMSYMEQINGTNIDLQNKLKELINTPPDFNLENLPGKVIDNLGKVGDFLNTINEAAKVEGERIKNETIDAVVPELEPDETDDDNEDINKTIGGRTAGGKDPVDAVQPDEDDDMVELIENENEDEKNITKGNIIMASSAGGISGRTVDNILIGIIILAIIALVAFVVVKRNWRKIKTRFTSSEPAPPPDRELEEIPLRNKV